MVSEVLRIFLNTSPIAISCIMEVTWVAHSELNKYGYAKKHTRTLKLQYLFTKGWFSFTYCSNTSDTIIIIQWGKYLLQIKQFLIKKESILHYLKLKIKSTCSDTCSDYEDCIIMWLCSLEETLGLFALPSHLHKWTDTVQGISEP